MSTRWLLAVVSVFSLSVVARTASAQATRTWVSGVGDDVNPCSRTAPCKTWAGAISKTAAGGEIDALDPGGFGAVTITKSITIDGRGALASILASNGTTGINVNAGANDVVIIRGISINGAGTTLGLNGIKLNSAAAVHVEDCHVFGFQQAILATPAASPGILYVKNTVISNNTAGVLVGAMAQAVITKSVFFADGTGLRVQNAARAAVADSVFAGNTVNGLWAENTAVIDMDRGMIANNGVGVRGDSTVRLSDVMVSHNSTGLMGTVVSFGNNRVKAGNGADGTPTSTIPEQ